MQDLLDKTHEIASKLESKGYRVLIEPRSQQLPFDLDGYEPDLIAFDEREEGGLIVEIKSKIKELSISRFQNISDTISSHKGWRFAIVTLDKSISEEFSSVETQLLELDAIKKRYEQTTALIEMKMFAPALLEIWSLIEACLRILAQNQHLPINFLPLKQLINHLYSNGDLSMEQTDQLKEMMTIRNNVAHGFNENLTVEHLSDANHLLQELIDDIDAWSPLQPTS